MKANENGVTPPTEQFKKTVQVNALLAKISTACAQAQLTDDDVAMLELMAKKAQPAA